jgi:hypothetical protein
MIEISSRFVPVRDAVAKLLEDSPEAQVTEAMSS